MLGKVVRALWGDLTGEELKKFGILSLAIMFILGVYWMLRTTKNPLFDHLVGFKQYQPIVKIFSLFVMIFVVLGYSKLVDIFRKDKLIYLMCTAYGLSFLMLSYFISHPDVASISTTSAFYPMVSWIPGKALGWFAYVLLESYGSLVVALFYSFVASVMTADLAKKGYGLMAFITQIGTITGTLISMFFVKKIGIPMLYFIAGAIIIVVVPLIIKLYGKEFPKDITASPKGDNKKKTGFFEGLRLILTKPYIMGVMVVVTFYEIISTVIEYQMNYVAFDFYATPEQKTVFTSIQALGINFFALLFAFIGTSFFMRKFGLRFCLMAFPTAIGVVVCIPFIAKAIGMGDYALIWILLSASIATKGLNYALNKPSAEVLYIPTSKDVKFKAKGWIDMFGNRTTKGMGVTISNGLNSSLPVLIYYGTFISLGIIGIWLLVASYVGNRFNKLQKDHTIVE